MLFLRDERVNRVVLSLTLLERLSFSDTLGTGVLGVMRVVFLLFSREAEADRFVPGLIDLNWLTMRFSGKKEAAAVVISYVVFTS